MLTNHNKFILLGKHIMTENLLQKNFKTSKVVTGIITPVPNYISLYQMGNTLVMTNQYVDNNDLEKDMQKKDFKGDYYDFETDIVDIIRKYPITEVNNDKTFSAKKHLVIEDIKWRTFYVKLKNGDVYEVKVSNGEFTSKDDDVKISKKKHMAIKKIKSSIGVIVEGRYKSDTSFIGYEYDDLPTIKTGDGTSPVIQPFKIADDWVGLNYYPNPYYAVFLGFKKSDYDIAMKSNGNAIDLYLIADGATMKIPEGVRIKKAILVNDNGHKKFLYLTDTDEVWYDDKRIGKKDIGIYWTEIRGVMYGCLNRCYVQAQYLYLYNVCAFSNPYKAYEKCARNGWSGVGIKSMHNENNVVVKLPTSCDCKFYQDARNFFPDRKIVGVPVYYDDDGKLKSLNDNYTPYFCDGSKAIRTCHQKDDDVKETIEAYDFYYQNKQINQLLHCKSLSDYEFYEVPAFVEAPLRVKYQTKDEIRLPR